MPDRKVQIRLTGRDETREAVQSVRQGLRSISTQLDALRSQSLRFAAAIATVRGVVVPLANIARDALRAADDLSALSEQTGIAVETLSALSHAATISNTSIETVATAAKRLSTLMLQAATGGKEAKRTLDAFGIGATDSLEEAFRKIGEQLAQLPDGWERNALAVKLFGRSGAELIPLLKGLGPALDDARKKGLVLSSDLARAADNINDAMDTVRESISAALLRSIEGNLPAITAALDAIAEGFGHNGLAGGVDAALGQIRELDGALGSIAAVLQEHGRLIGQVVLAYAGFKVVVGVRGLIAGLLGTIASIGPVLRQAAVGAGVLRVAISGLGGPLGLLATAITTAAGAWAFFGARAEESLSRAQSAIERAKGAAGSFADLQIRGQLGADQILPELNRVKDAYAEQLQVVSQLRERQREIGTGFGSQGIFRDLQAAQATADALLERIKIFSEQYAAARKTIAGETRTDTAAPDQFRSLLDRLQRPAKGSADKDAATRLRALIESELALIKDANERALAALERRLDGHTISLRDYYAERVRLEQDAIDAEIAGLERQLAAARKDGSERERIESQIIILRRKRADVAIQAAADERKAEADLNQAVIDLRARLAEAKGQSLEARRLRIEQELKDLLDSFTGEVPEEVIALTVELRGVELARAEFEELQRQLQEIETRRHLKEQTIQAEASTQLFGEFQQRGRLVEVYRETAAELDRLIPRLQALAAAHPELPEIAQAVAEAQVQLTELRGVSNQTALEVGNALQSSTADLFVDLVDGAKSAGDAFEDFAHRVLDAIKRILAEKFAEALFGNLAGGGKAGNSGGGILGFLGGLFGFARGGYVEGPGTATSDSIPARLSAGEYVLSARAVSRLGVAALDAMNGLDFSPPQVRAGRLGFASGGLVPDVLAPPAAPRAVPAALRVTVHPEALHLTLRDWLEGELARVAAAR